MYPLELFREPMEADKLRCCHAFCPANYTAWNQQIENSLPFREVIKGAVKRGDMIKGAKMSVSQSASQSKKKGSDSDERETHTHIHKDTQTHSHIHSNGQNR